MSFWEKIEENFGTGISIVFGIALVIVGLLCAGIFLLLGDSFLDAYLDKQPTSSPSPAFDDAHLVQVIREGTGRDWGGLRLAEQMRVCQLCAAYLQDNYPDHHASFYFGALDAFYEVPDLRNEKVSHVVVWALLYSESIQELEQDEGSVWSAADAELMSRDDDETTMEIRDALQMEGPIEGEFVRAGHRTVTLRKESGELLSIPIHWLSEEDRRQLPLLRDNGTGEFKVK